MVDGPDAELSMVAVERRQDVTHVSLARLSRRNALSRSLHHELGDVLDEVARSDSRFVVIRGGGHTFSSGGDLDELAQGLPANYVEDYWERMRATVLRLRSMPQIVIAVVEGVAVGAGAALACAADLIVLASDARLRWNFAHIGLLPDAGTSRLLPQAVGPALARELLYTGRWMAAEEARAVGLVNYVCPPSEIEDVVQQCLEDLRAAPAETLTLVKELLEQAINPSLAADVRREGVFQAAASTRTAFTKRIATILHRIPDSRLETRP